MMEKDDIIIRKVEPSDFDNLVKLYCEVWPAKSCEGKSEHFTSWERKASFVMKESTGVSYLAEKNGKIVGSRTSFFMNAYYGNRKLICVQYADSCVSKECRGKHLFLRLNEAFLNEYFNEAGGELIYNISVEASRKAYEKLGWVYIKSLTGFKKYLNPLKTLWKLRFDIRKLAGTPIWDIESHITSIDEHLLDIREAEMLKSDTIHIRYDKETFLWRMKSQSGIKMWSKDGLGCIIYKIGKKPHGTVVVFIGEVFLYKYTRVDLKALFKAFNKEIKPELVLADMTLNHPLYKFYKKLGFLQSKIFANHGVKVLTDEMKQICLNPQNWALSFMDIDTF